MRGLFNLDSPIMRFLSRLADLVMLNLITLLCCIPLVTAGAAISAMYAAVYKMKQEEGSLFKNFFHALRINLLQATVQWLILVASAALLLFAFFYYSGASFALSSVLQFVCIFFLLLWMFCASWVFPLQAKFHVTVKGNLKNALVCAFAFLPATVGMVVVNSIPFIIFLVLPAAFFRFGYLWIFLYFSLAAWINDTFLTKPFRIISKEAPDDTQADKTER